MSVSLWHGTCVPIGASLNSKALLREVLSTRVSVKLAATRIISSCDRSLALRSPRLWVNLACLNCGHPVQNNDANSTFDSKKQRSVPRAVTKIDRLKTACYAKSLIVNLGFDPRFWSLFEISQK